MDERAHRAMASVEQRHWWFRSRRRLIENLLNHHAPSRPGSEGRILEIGSGTGGNVGLLERFGDVTCIEPGPVGAAFIRDRFPAVTVLEQPWPGVACELGKFDVALFLDVLEHLDDDVAALRAVHGHLSPKGCVLVTVPAYQWMWSEHDVQLWHRRRYSRQQFMRMAQNAGFGIEFVSGFNATLLPAAWFSRRLGLEAGTGDVLPHPLLNAVFEWILRTEAALVSRGVPLPFGLSIVAVLRESERA